MWKSIEVLEPFLPRKHGSTQVSKVGNVRMSISIKVELESLIS